MRTYSGPLPRMGERERAIRSELSRIARDLADVRRYSAPDEPRITEIMRLARAYRLLARIVGKEGA